VPLDRVLCLLAHPDDELFCAGLLAHLSRRGIPIHLSFLTSGEGGGLRGHPEASPTTIAAYRKTEVECSAGVLGIEQISFMNYPDPSPKDRLIAPPHDPARILGELRTLIEEQAPTLVLTHGSNGDYGHPAHELLHQMSLRALADMPGDTPALFTFNAFHPSLPHPALLNEDDWADAIVDVSPMLPKKTAVLNCHASQWDAFVVPQPSDVDYRAAVARYVEQRLSSEGYCRQWPGTVRSPLVSLTDWLHTDGTLGVRTPKTSSGDQLRRYRHRVQLGLKRSLQWMRAGLIAARNAIIRRRERPS
jgi:LmbE family N-acetylglucosaminyl deacetylase